MRVILENRSTRAVLIFFFNHNTDEHPHIRHTHIRHTHVPISTFKRLRLGYYSILK